MSAGPVSTILVVECAEIRALLTLMLEKQGYRVLQADLEHAAAVLQEKDKQICALITNTPQYFLRFGDLQILYIAAIPDPELTPYCTAVLRKPFTYLALSNSIRELLDSREIPTKPPSRETACGDSSLRTAAGRA